jgi:hypothetical protein
MEPVSRGVTLTKAKPVKTGDAKPRGCNRRMPVMPAGQPATRGRVVVALVGRFQGPPKSMGIR